MRRPISIANLTAIVKVLAPIKLSGPDMVVAGLYKVMWSVRGTDYLKMLNETLEAKEFKRRITEELCGKAFPQGSGNKPNKSGKMKKN